MSDLLLTWLNDEIQLSRRVNSFEEDFRNGYLLGELLAKYSQQLNFPQFVDKQDKSSRINNFALLLDTCVALKVTFDSNTAMRVINGHYGVARKLLYELKSQLQKTNQSSKTKMSKTLSPLKKIQVGKDKYDEVNRDHFLKQLNQLHPAQKDIIQGVHLRKFGDFQQKVIAKVAQLDEKDKQAKLLLRSRFIEQQRQNLKKSEQFRKQWEETQGEKWEANMQIRNGQAEKDDLYRRRLMESEMQGTKAAELSAMRSLERDIAQFEKKHLQPDSSDEEQQQLQVTSKTKGEGRVEERKKRVPAVVDEKVKHQREKRRRKTIVEQNKRYQMIEISRRERYIVATLEQTSKQEKEIQYELWRAWQNKQIIIEDRRIRTEKERDKDDTRSLNADFKRQQLLKTLRDEHKKELSEAVSRFNKSQTSTKVEQRKGIYAKCGGIVETLLDITQQVYRNQQERNQERVDEQLMDRLTELFVNAPKDTAAKGQLELANYVEGRGQWRVKIPKAEEPSDPTEEGALPANVVNNYFLGNTLKTLYEAQASRKEAEEGRPDRLVFCLLGLQFAAKKSLAGEIAQKYGVNVVSVEALVSRKLEEYRMLTEKGLQVSQDTQEIAQMCLGGRELPASLVGALIEQEIGKSEQTLLLDYPKTYHQAVQLTSMLAGIRPTDYSAKSELHNKIQRFSRLVKPTAPKVTLLSRRHCGVDCALWVPISIEESLDRMLGRRWSQDGDMQHINGEVKDVYDLATGPRASSIIMQNSFKSKHQKAIQEWFSLFGEGGPCWRTTTPGKSLEDTRLELFSIFEETLQLREKRKAKANEEAERKARQQALEEEIHLQKEDLRNKCVFTAPDQLKIQLQGALSAVKLDVHFISKTINLWERMEGSSVSALCRIFGQMEEQEVSCNVHISQLKKAFIGMLTRQDQKFFLAKQFQRKYNGFYEQNMDMVSNEYTKEEMHQRVDDLEGQLIDIVQEKREDALAEKNNVATSGWLEAQYDILYECLYVLMQTELTRYFTSEKILTDFYAKKFSLTPKEEELPSIDLNKEVFAAIESIRIKEDAFPKLDKMVSESLRIFNREEEVAEEKGKKGGKAPPPPKKEDKKKKGGKEEPVRESEPTKEEIELKRAINTQRAIFRYRIAVLKQFGMKKLRWLSEMGQRLYVELQDLYLYTYRVEKKAVSNLAGIFRKAIEEEKKIEYEVQIHHVEIIETQRIRNFEKEKPVILPAREHASPHRFTVAQAREVIKLIGNESEGSRITTRKLITVLRRLTENEQLKTLLPDQWKHLTAQKWEHFVRLLDVQKGYVDLSRIFLFVLFCDSRVPSAKSLEEYRLQLTSYGTVPRVNAEVFLKTKAWFDSEEPKEENVKPFERSRLLKEIVFEIYREGQTMEVQRFVEEVSLGNGNEGQTYFDVGFGGP